MPVKLSTTISKIESLTNSVNSLLISELCDYMKKNGLSDSHINNTLKTNMLFSNNIISLNVNLTKAPSEIIHYIIIHELCHFKITGHSYNFWNLIRSYVPDYPKLIEWLNINGKNLLS